MKRTSPGAVVGLILAGGVLLYLLQLLFQTRGEFIFVPPISLPVTLFIVAIGVVVLAIPVRRAVNGKKNAKIDPFYASRIVALAKATTYVGALLSGAGAGILIFVVARPVAPPLGMVTSSIALILTAILLIVAGLVAENFCTLPPDDPEKEITGDVAA
jgi:polyferredoxin